MESTSVEANPSTSGNLAKEQDACEALNSSSASVPAAIRAAESQITLDAQNPTGNASNTQRRMFNLYEALHFNGSSSSASAASAASLSRAPESQKSTPVSAQSPAGIDAASNQRRLFNLYEALHFGGTSSGNHISAAIRAIESQMSPQSVEKTTPAVFDEATAQQQTCVLAEALNSGSSANLPAAIRQNSQNSTPVNAQDKKTPVVQLRPFNLEAHLKSGGASSSANAKPIVKPEGKSPGKPPKTETSLMMRNLPLTYTRGMLLREFEMRGVLRDINFVYMPIDLRYQCNAGYCFVNVVGVAAMARFSSLFRDTYLLQVSSEKAVTLEVARTQGLDANVELYRSSYVMTLPEQYQPLILQNGEKVPFPPPIGRIKKGRKGKLAYEKEIGIYDDEGDIIRSV